jgi:HlyD family secretion protein
VLIGLLSRTRLVVAGLAIVALVLGTLIYRDMFVPSKSAGSSLNLYTVARRTVMASITGSGNLEPQAQSNVNFKVAGTLTAIYVHVGDHVSAGQSLAAIDASAEQNAVAQAQANLSTAEANLQSAETPLTQNQITQLQDAVATAQQTYNDTVSQVNLTSTQDATQVSADQIQLTSDQQSLTFNSIYQQAVAKLATDRTTLQTAISTFNTDGCQSQTYVTYSTVCLTDFNAVSSDQSAVNADQLTVNTQAAQVDADQARLNADTAKQTADKTNGQRSINQAASSLTSAQDQLKTQTEARPNQIASAQAQLSSAQAVLATAQQNLANTTLVSPMDGEVNSINGVVGENVAPGGGTTAEAPGSQAPLPTSAASSAFMVIGNVSGMEVVIPFAEADASKLAFNQDAQVTFDALPNLTISGHVIAVASAATVTSGVVNYYATIVLNQTDKALKQGMTANATVTVSKAANAIVVPNLAITRTAGQAYVNVYSGGQQVPTQVETGVVGDQFTEVTGGLNEGEQVVLPTVRAATGSGSNNGRFGGGNGGGVRIGTGG